tara:strand:+ start:203 stop:1141 length:939 start_codon:yes stop_codon:yes gene_type:complete
MTSNVKEIRRIESEKVLGFNPYSKEADAFLIEITPEQAQYILDYHNGDNRKLVKSQVNNIVKSINKDGWLFDGQPLTFNIEGNITEFQHRLHAIVQTGVTAKISVTLGVETGCFTKCAPAKPRKAEDEIQRKDKTATQSEASTLRQVLIRRKGAKLTIQNAIDKWEFWKTYVRDGRKLVDTFFAETDEYNPWERTFAAWGALMKSIGQEKIVTDFLDLLESEIKDDTSPCCLTREFDDFWCKHQVRMSNTGRTELVWQLLCVASDRMIKDPTGNTQLNLKIDKCNHEYLSKKGVYRKFLENPQNITLVGQLP